MSYSFNSKRRCPNCGGFAGAYKDSKRCRGFAHRDDAGYFCEVPNEGKRHDFSGYTLYYYRYEDHETLKDMED